jgi:hypothetical protein
MEMKKYFITLCTYPEGNKVKDVYEKQNKPHFIDYCKLHGFEFIEITKNEAEPYNVCFAKMFWIKKNMNKFNDGDVVTYMDIDCCIMDARVPFIFDTDFSIVEESTGVICMGTWSLRISEWSRKFVEAFCSEKMQKDIKKTKFMQYWQDNGAVYLLLGIPWGNRWGMLSKELKKHVQFLPAKWGCTFQKDDTDLTKPLSFNGKKDVNKTYKVISRFVLKERECRFDEIVVRHLSAGTMLLPWADRYYNTKMKV